MYTLQIERKAVSKPIPSIAHIKQQLTKAKQNINANWDMCMFSEDATVDIYGSSYDPSVNVNEKIITEIVKYSINSHCCCAIMTHTCYSPYVFTLGSKADVHLPTL